MPKVTGILFFSNQAILLNNKVVTKAVFSGTCVKAGVGRPFLPENLLDKLVGAPEWDGEL